MKPQSISSSDLIWQSGVLKARDGQVWLEFDDPGACKRCSQGRGCGAALFSQLFPRPCVAIPLPQYDALPPGRRVLAGLSPRWLMMAAAALYLLPVLSFLAGCLAAEAIWPANDLAALSLGVLVSGLAIRSLGGRLRSKRPPGLELVEIDAALESGRTGDHLPSHDA